MGAKEETREERTSSSLFFSSRGGFLDSFTGDRCGCGSVRSRVEADAKGRRNWK